jgi:hypothetical protein
VRKKSILGEAGNRGWGVWEGDLVDGYRYGCRRWHQGGDRQWKGCRGRWEGNDGGGGKGGATIAWHAIGEVKGK